MRNRDNDSGRKRGMLRTTFRYASLPFRMAFYFARFWTKPVLCAGTVSLATCLAPGTVSRDVDDFFRTADLDDSLFENIHHENIRVYHRYSPLPFFHTPGHLVKESLGLLAHGDFSQNDYADLTIKAGVAALMLGIGYPYSLFNSTVRALLTVATGSSAYAVKSLEGACYIMPGAYVSPADSIAETAIKKSDLLPLSYTARHVFEYVLAHEGKHCDGADEHGADIYAVNMLENQAPGFSDFIKYERSLHVFSHEGKSAFVRAALTLRDVEHATSVAIDYWQKGQTIPSQTQIEESHGRIYESLEKELKSVGSDMPSAYRVYVAMKNMLADNTFANDALSRRIVEIYVEAIDGLVKPERIMAYTNPQSMPEF